MQDFNKAITLSNSDPLHHNNMAVLFLELGRLEEALEHIEQAVRLAPESPMHYGNRSMVYDEMGDKVKANQDYIHAAQLAAAQLQAELALNRT